MGFEFEYLYNDEFEDDEREEDAHRVIEDGLFEDDDECSNQYRRKHA